MPQQSAYNTWCNGSLNQEVIDFWKELKSMSTIELSQLTPFLRLSSVEYIFGENGEIKNIIPYKEFDFLKSELQSESKKGFYGLESFDLEVTGMANSLYKGTILLKLYDINLINDSKFKKIISLGSNLKIDFGWNKWDWGEDDKISNINSYLFHGGHGHTLFSVVSGREITINDENILEITLNFTSSTYNLMNNKKLQNLIEIEWDKVPNIQDINTVSQGSFQWFRNIWGKTFSKKAILLKDLIQYLTEKIKENKDFNTIINEFDFSVELEIDNIQNLKSIDKNILLKDGGNSVGDFFITIKKVDELYAESTTYKKFINNILKIINKAYETELNLNFIQTPQGNVSVIKDKAEDSTNVWNNKEKYLTLDFGKKNNLCSSISFSSDLDDARKNIEIYTNVAQIKGATPNQLKSFAITWLYDKETWNNFDENEKNTIIQNLNKDTPDELLKVLLEETDLKQLAEDEKNDAIKEIKSIVINKEIRNNTIRYMPYKISATLFGISDIWTGTNIYLDENFINPLHQNTIWQITDIKHSLSGGDWQVSIEAGLIFDKKMDELTKKIEKELGFK